MSTKKILIADDDTAMLKALTIRLEQEGFEVFTAQDSYQALQIARTNDPDLLLLDVNMPAGDGFSVQDRIHQTPDLPDKPVIYVTGESSENVDEIAEEHGACAIIHKPFEIEELLSKIRSALGYWESKVSPVES